jgi:hypothetical protein
VYSWHERSTWSQLSDDWQSKNDEQLCPACLGVAQTFEMQVKPGAHTSKPLHVPPACTLGWQVYVPGPLQYSVTMQVEVLVHEAPASTRGWQRLPPSLM